jgi:hypothetical protein
MACVQSVCLREAEQFRLSMILASSMFLLGYPGVVRGGFFGPRLRRGSIWDEEDVRIPNAGHGSLVWLLESLFDLAGQKMTATLSLNG